MVRRVPQGPAGARRGLTRRELLAALGRGAGAVALLPWLSRCAPEGVGGGPSPTGPVTIRVASLPLAIDAGREGSPTLERFTAETGIGVDRREVVGDPGAFVRSLLPRLEVGEPTGWDVVVLPLGDALATLLAWDLLAELPRTRPNFTAHAADFVRDPSWDPGNRFTMALRAEATGIGSNPRRTGGRPVRRLRELLGGPLAGAVGMPADPLELGNVGLLAAGADPATAGPEEWAAAARLLGGQRDRGVVRGYYGRREAVAALAAGEVAAAVVRSADLFLANPTGDPAGLTFAYPEEGALLWVDAMAVPAGSPHVAEAATFMDFLYRPDVAAGLAAQGGYLSPVPGSRAELRARAAATADPEERSALQAAVRSPLVYPGPEAASRFVDPAVPLERRETWDALFRPIAAGRP
ncbi:MAG TPA: extracellular solute-binding protein [Actinomycetota bacterium]|nr:extracellular solute-binding protein [Actinomycetota bacterium]